MARMQNGGSGRAFSDRALLTSVEMDSSIQNTVELEQAASADALARCSRLTRRESGWVDSGRFRPAGAARAGGGERARRVQQGIEMEALPAKLPQAAVFKPCSVPSPLG